MGEYPARSPRVCLRARAFPLLLFRGPNQEVQQTCEEGTLKYSRTWLLSAPTEFKLRESDRQKESSILDGQVKGWMSHELLTRGIKIFAILGMTNRRLSRTPIIPTQRDFVNI